MAVKNAIRAQLANLALDSVIQIGLGCGPHHSFFPLIPTKEKLEGAFEIQNFTFLKILT